LYKTKTVKNLISKEKNTGTKKFLHLHPK